MAWTEKYVDLADGGAGDGSSGDPWASYDEAIAELGALAGPTKIYVRGNGTLGATLAFSLNGTVANPIWWIGCTGSGATWTPIGNDASATKPTLTCSTYQVTVTGDDQTFENLAFVSECITAGGGVNNTSAGTGCTFLRCRFVNSAASTAARAFTLGAADSIAVGCYFECPTSGTTALYAVYVVALRTLIMGCHIKGGESSIGNDAQGVLFLFNILEAADSNSAIVSNVSCFVIGNTITTCGADGIRSTDTAALLFIANNLIHSAGGIAINNSAGDSYGLRTFANLWYNCLTNGVAGNPEDMEFWNTGTASADPLPNLTDPANNANDFDLAISQQRLAFPGVFEAGAYAFTGRMSHGAVQPLPDFPTAGNTLKEDTVDGATGDYYGPNLDSNPGVVDAAAVVTGAHFGVGNATGGEAAGGGGYTYGDEDQAFVLTTATGAGTYQPVAASAVQKGVAVGVSPAVGTLVGVVDSAGTQHDYGTCSSVQAWAAAGIVHTAGTAAASGILNSGGTYAASGVFAGGAGTIYATTGLSVGEVLSTVATWRDGDGDHAGTYVQPVTGQVLAPAQGGTAFGPSSGTSGTLTFADTTYVLSTAPDYGIAGTGGAKTATLTADGNVLTGTGVFGVGGTSVTPSYTPDFPDVENVATTDTVNGTPGTLDVNTYYASGYADGEAAGYAQGYAVGTSDQLATDEAAVFAAAEWIVSGHSILGQAGTFDLSLYTLTSGIVWPAVGNVSTVEAAWGPTGAEYAGALDLTLYCLIAGITWPALDEVDGGVNFGPVTGLEYEGTGVNATTAQAAAAAAITAAALATAANLATANTLLSKVAPRLIGTLSGAGTGTEICVYGGTTVTYTVDEDGNISNVVFS